MARPLRIEYPGAFYHVIQRGTERKNIFIQNSDKKKFLFYLDSAHTAYNAIFHSYALMNNHYHIIIETPRGNLSKVMHYLNTSYAAYFNTTRKRVGPLYQGRYKAILVQEDEYLHHLSKYIHLNPVRSKIVKNPEEYHWSSYRYFTSNEKLPPWLNIKFILSMFDSNIAKAKSLYRKFVLEEIGTEKDIIQRNTKKGFILGGDDFFETIIDKFVNKEDDPEIHILKELKYRKEPTLGQIKNIVEENGSNNRRLQRRLTLYLSRKHTQKTLNQIASFYGRISDAGVSQAVKRVQAAIGRKGGPDKILSKLEKKINLLNVET